VNDGNATHGSSASVMEMTKAIEQIFPSAPNFTAVNTITKFQDTFIHENINRIVISLNDVRTA
jgi:mannose/fructose-specific phosphotransferase system component IIA